MAYTVKARFYADPDQFGESYVITSDNADSDTRIEVGSKVTITEHCDHEIISIRNKVIKDGFMCVRCKKLFKEYTGEPIKPDMKIPRGIGAVLT